MLARPKQLFYQLSIQLTGVDALSESLAEVYYGILDSNAVISPFLNELLIVYEQIVRDNPADLSAAIQNQILGDSQLRDLALKIIKLWYLGIIKELDNGDVRIPALTKGGFYFHHEALIWKVAHAHPAGLSGGYYGYWAYKPEN